MIPTRIIISPFTAHRAAARLAALAALSLCGCASGSSSVTMQDMALAQRSADRAVREPFGNNPPVVLMSGKGALGPAAKPIDQAQVKPAIERFAEGRRQQTGAYVVTGATLSNDGKTHAVVLFTSQNWCQPQGCDLAIFEQGSFGWRSVATISRVRAPVRISRTMTAGWHDLWVVTGREPKAKDNRSFVQNVRLQYGSGGYPSTTTFAISSTQGEPDGDVLIQSAEQELPSKARLATGGRDPEHAKTKAKALAPAAATAVQPAPKSP